MWFKRFLVALVTISLVGCNATTGFIKGSSTGSGFIVGPSTSTEAEEKENKEMVAKPAVKLDVVIPIFDPGITKENEEKIWPELRRAEATSFAWMLKAALEETESFGAVRVTPNRNATAEIYVIGKIVESTGEDVEISLMVSDISGRDLIKGSRIGGFGFASQFVGDSLSAKSFSHTVEEKYLNNIRNKEKDGYAPLFEEAAKYIEELVIKVPADRGEELKTIADIRFATSLSNDAFAENLDASGDEVKLIKMPSAADPTFQKVRTLRVRDQMFVDTLQNEYGNFNDKLSNTHRVWQEQVLKESEARSEARKKAVGQAIGAVALIGLAVLSAQASADASQNYDATGATLGATGAVIAGVAGIEMIKNTFHTMDEAGVHTDLIEELGDSIDVEVAPQVVEFEKSQEKLVGDASQQFKQWREFLKRIYELEQTPNIQL
jgi:hypothetical protein